MTTETPPRRAAPAGAPPATRTGVTVALAGNPNSGKTTLFNAITGARQHVGNYPGVTVEVKTGRTSRAGADIAVVDLPGTISLTADSPDEVLARDFVLDGALDVVIDVVDCANLERNLYLATQFMELGVPMVLAFNMSDLARARGCHIDDAALSELLGVPIVRTVGNRGQGVEELLAAALSAAGDAAAATARLRPIRYGREIEPHVRELTAQLDAARGAAPRNRWFALKLLEGDAHAADRLRRAGPPAVEAVIQRAGDLRRHIESVCGEPAPMALADRRYGFISGACREAVTPPAQIGRALSDSIDAVLTNRVLGLPIFALLMYLAFQLTFTVAEPPMAVIEAGRERLAGAVSGLWERGSDSIPRSLLVDGVIGGVGGVLVFLPNIVLLFLAIALLEDSGYMARAAFLVDRLMHKIGLHGKSFIPMLVGFGCTVPAILATRVLESRRDRLTTMMVAPLMSCGARLPIYALFIPAFFPPGWRGPILWGIYVTGILLAVVAARLLRSTALRGESTPFVMELPPYRMPTVKGLALHMWERTRLYVRKAGTVILGFAIVLWAATTFPRKTVFDRDYDGLAEAARARHVQAAGDFTAAAGLPAGSPLLAAAIEAELKTDAARARYWPGEAGLAAAAARQAATLETLRQAEGGGAALAAFLDARDAIRRIAAEFDHAVARGPHEPGSHEHDELSHKRDAALARVQLADPKTHAAAAKFLDEIEAPFESQLAELAAARRAETLAHSLAGRIGRGMEPALRPLGFDWRIGTALIGALGAKETFVAQLGIVFSLGDSSGGAHPLRQRLRQAYSPLVGFCVMLFCLISSPCVATVAATRKESRSWLWAAGQWAGLTAMAYLLTAIVYQLGSLLA